MTFVTFNLSPANCIIMATWLAACVYPRRLATGDGSQEIFYQGRAERMGVTLYQGDCIEVLRTLPDCSVQTCVTSPPYWGLRDYGVAGQIGLEPTPEEYTQHLVAVFREVRRVLRDDGTLWLNLGDSYMSQPSWGRGDQSSTLEGRKHSEVPHALKDQLGRHERGRQPGIKTKDLVGIPWMVAFALRADGWYLRSDIVWHKLNCMPESVDDRPTKSHEYIFLLSKSARYYYDAEAVKEPAQEWTGQAATFKREAGKVTQTQAPGQAHTQHRADRKQDQVGKRTYTGFNERWDNATPSPTRNRRSVWTVATQPYKGAHFATYPPKLIEPCILAGSSERGACPICGAPWERLTEKESSGARLGATDGKEGALRHDTAKWAGRIGETSTTTAGWQSTCDHNAAPVACTVLDPFNGAGTTGLVATQYGRDYIGIDLNANYLALTQDRLSSVQPMLLPVQPVNYYCPRPE